MVSPLLFYQLALIALVWLCLMLQWAWPSARTLSPTTSEPPPPRRKRHRVPKPFTGLTTKPHCDKPRQNSLYEIGEISRPCGIGASRYR
jgi:hypothetical protein